MVTARVPAPGDDGTIDHQDFPLLIAVAASVEDRVRLAELVDDVAALLLVSSLDELRKLLTPAQDPPPAPAEQSPPSRTPDAGRADRRTGDSLTIDSNRSVAQWRGSEAPLTDLEHDLLAKLMSEPVKVWTYEQLHQAVWRNRDPRSTADVHSLVKRLRRKLDDLGTTVTIDAVRGTGFRLADHQHPAIPGLRAG